MTPPHRREPEPPEPADPGDVDLTRDDLEREADRAADRYERALWGDDLYPPRGGWGAL